MSFNGSGLFQINTTGQPVTSGTTIDSSDFNDLTADLATGLSNVICKDGQTTLTANIPFGGFKATGLAIGTSSTDSASVENCNVAMCEGRLTLTSGTPVTTTDVTAAETLYFTPFRGNRIALYDGANWVMRTFTEVSIDVPDVTGVHDVFAYDSSGVTLEVLVWTNTTTRATNLTTQNGVLVKTGDATRRYLGTFYSTTAGNGQIEDSLANRYLWNYYNRIPRAMRRIETTATWNYSTISPRQANNSTLNQLNFVIGWGEIPVTADLLAAVKSTTATDEGINYITLDGLSPPGDAAGTTYGYYYIPANNAVVTTYSHYVGYPGIGKHFLAWVESPSVSAGTTTWYGTTVRNSGIHGVVWG